MPTTVVVNPASAHGRGRREWPSIESALTAAIGPVAARFTDGPLAAATLCREALGGGADLVIAVGGDGTINEVVNGFFDAQPLAAARAALGVITVGTGGDFRRTLGLPLDVRGQVQAIAAGRERRLDIGRLTLTTDSGGRAVRYFNNIASFGLSGATDAMVNRLTVAKRLGGKLAFQWGMVKALATYRNQPVRIAVDDTFDRVVTVQTAGVCNGQYFGGGMRFAPRAVPDDGLFDVVIVADLSVFGLLRRVQAVYTGAHLDTAHVTWLRGARVVAEPVAGAGAVLLDVDGETPGRLPATFEMVPSALRVRC